MQADFQMRDPQSKVFIFTFLQIRNLVNAAESHANLFQRNKIFKRFRLNLKLVS
jgi:hypothetical protein